MSNTEKNPDYPFVTPPEWSRPFITPVAFDEGVSIWSTLQHLSERLERPDLSTDERVECWRDYLRTKVKQMEFDELHKPLPQERAAMMVAFWKRRGGLIDAINEIEQQMGEEDEG